MIGLLAAAGFASAVLVALAVGRGMSGGEEALALRLQQLTGQGTVDMRQAELGMSFLQRVVRPALQRLAVGLGRWLPAEKRQAMQQLLRRAGQPGSLSPVEFGALKLILTILISVLLLLGLFPRNAAAAVLLAGIGGALAWLAPDTWLKRRAATRLEEVRCSLPEMLDLLTVCVEAGLGLDGALARVAEKKKGALAEETARLLQEIQLGKPRRDALRDMAGRLGSPELSAFVAALVQADRLGLPMAGVLRAQADRIRMKRRQEVEEQAMKLPVKMLVPLIIFIFPTIFIVLLGPAVLQIMRAFTG